MKLACYEKKTTLPSKRLVSWESCYGCCRRKLMHGSGKQYYQKEDLSLKLWCLRACVRYRCLNWKEFHILELKLSPGKTVCHSDRFVFVLYFLNRNFKLLLISRAPTVSNLSQTVRDSIQTESYVTSSWIAAALVFLFRLLKKKSLFSSLNR